MLNPPTEIPFGGMFRQARPCCLAASTAVAELLVAANRSAVVDDLPSSSKPRLPATPLLPQLGRQMRDLGA